MSGVAARQLEGLYRERAIDLWIPLDEKNIKGADRSRRNFWILGRLRRAVSPGRAQNAIQSSKMIVRRYTGMTPEMGEGVARISKLFDFAAAPHSSSPART